MTVDEIWGELEAREAEGNAQGFLVRRVHTASGLWLAQALERPGNIRILTLRVARAAALVSAALPEGGGFEARWCDMPGEAHQVHLQLVLLEPRFQDIFSRFVQDVIDRVQNINDERTAVSAFITQLERWQAFLRNRGTNLLDEIERQGLYGELWVLRNVLLPNFEPAVAVEAWTGPRATPQDFRLPLGFFEIKTTSSANPREVTISSAAQLDDSFGKPIILIFLTIRLDTDVGENLPDLVAGLRQNLAEHPDTVGVFEGKLFEAGYLNEDALEYSMPRYAVQNIVFYLVGSGFPRITPAMLPPGVSTVEYTINLASCRPHVIPKSMALNLVSDSHE
jgi:Putative  PD-(D/E)XK family member, (DUF4420)